MEGVSADLDRVHQCPEVVVGQDHAPRLFRDLAAAPHRDADVRLLQRGGVVHGVAGHGDDEPRLLHETAQP